MINTNMQIGKALQAASSLEDQKLKKALKGFESLFLNQLLKSMRTAFAPDDGESGLGKDTFMSITDQAVADHIADSGGIGIADLLYEHFRRQENSESGLKAVKTDDAHISIRNKREDRQVDIKNALDDLMKISRNARLINKVKDIAIDRVKDLRIPKLATESKPEEVKPDKIETAINKAAVEFKLKPELIRAVIRAESNFDPKAVSPKGAAGLMQLVDTTAADMGVKDRFDPEENVMGGAKYLRKMLDRFDGDLKLALAAYNAGPENVKKHDGIPPFAETIKYVDKVIKFMNEGNTGKDSKDLRRQAL